MRNAQVLIKSLVILTLAVLLSGLALAAEPKRGGTLRVAYGNKVSHLDFHTAPGYEMMWVAMNIGCGLVNVTPDGQFVGDVATAWELSDDAMTWTFRLRDDAFFHDNSRVDAEAVKFSIDRLMDPETRSGMRRFYESVQSVEVVDPLTVKVHMKRPYAFFLHMLAAYRTGLVLYSPAATQAPSSATPSPRWLPSGRAKSTSSPPSARSTCRRFRRIASRLGNAAIRRRSSAAVRFALSSGCQTPTSSWTAGKSTSSLASPTWTA